MLSIYDIDWLVFFRNLHIVQRKQGRFSCLLDQEGGDTRNSGSFYVAVLHYVLIL